MRVGIFLTLLAATAFAELRRYDGHQVLRFMPKNEMQMRTIFDLGELFPRLDFWTEPNAINRPVDIRVSPEEKERLVAHARQFNIEYSVMIEDLQENLDAVKVAPLGSKMTWDAYYRLADIFAWTEEMAEAYPDIVTLESIGTSTLGNEIRLMRINKASDQEKIAIFMNSNIHAREWITSATTTWMFNELLTNDAYSDVLDKFDFHYVPVLNPDGFEYTHTDDRLWRKTLSDHDSFWGCLGVDANRNWDKSFGGPGASDDKCSETYHGPSAFSEPETQAVSDYIMANREVIKSYFDVHSYSQIVLLPWGDTYDHPDDYDELFELGNLLADTIEARYGTRYVVGSVPDVLYLASGGSFDWVKAEAGVKYAYGIELRPDSSDWNGFVLPADEIIPSGEETLDGFLAFFNAVRDAVLGSKQ
jgi:hypothetical protein